MFSSFTVEHLGLNWLRVYARVEKVSDGTLLFFTKVMLKKFFKLHERL